MNGPGQTILHESRWPPALAILRSAVLLAALPGHVQVMPVWVSYLAALAVLVPMVAVALTEREHTVARHRANDDNSARRGLCR